MKKNTWNLEKTTWNLNWSCCYTLHSTIAKSKGFLKKHTSTSKIWASQDSDTNCNVHRLATVTEMSQISPLWDNKAQHDESG